MFPQSPRIAIRGSDKAGFCVRNQRCAPNLAPSYQEYPHPSTSRVHRPRSFVVRTGRSSSFRRFHDTPSPRDPFVRLVGAVGPSKRIRYDHLVAERKYKVLFIDFYGTIAAGDAEVVHSVCQRLVADLGLSLTPHELAVDWGIRFFEAADCSNHERFRTLYQCECESLIATVEPQCGCIDPAPYVASLVEYWRSPALHVEALEALARLDLPICCVSNADTEHIRSAIECHALAFDHLITSEDARCYKPEPAIFHRALDAVGAAPGEAVHVGDSLHSDVRGAENVGIDAVWICRNGRIHDIGTARPRHKISSLNELRDCLV